VVLRALLYSSFVVGIRMTQTWMAVYAADVYTSTSTVSRSTSRSCGADCWRCSRIRSSGSREIGCPLAGKMFGTSSRSAACPRHGRADSGWVLVGIASLAVA